MKGGGKMDSLKNLNEAMAFIEANLSDEIDYAEVAKIAYCSEYHFKRMFSFLAGIGIAEYVRRRRLTLAGLDLKNSDLKIIYLALKYGYDSADSFSRAFFAMHGILPSQIKKSNKVLKAYSRMSFHLSIQGDDEMNYRLVEKEAFKIIGFKKRVPIIFEGVNSEIVKMTERLTPEIVQQLKELSNVEPRGIISASTNLSDGRMSEKGELDHYIGVLSLAQGSANFDTLEVEAGTWAVFEAVGPYPDTLQNIWGRIYSEWFPTSGYEAISGPEILWNESPDTTNPQYKSEIWIPVKRK